MFSQISFQNGKNSFEKGLQRCMKNSLAYGYARDLRSTIAALERSEHEFFRPKIEGVQLVEVFEQLRSENEQMRAAEETMMDRAEVLRKIRAEKFEEQVITKEKNKKDAGNWLCVESEYEKWLEKHFSRLRKQFEALKINQVRYKNLSDVTIIKNILKEKLMSTSALLQKFEQELKSLENVSVEESEALATKTSVLCEAKNNVDIDRLRLEIEQQAQEETDLDIQIELIEREIIEANELCSEDLDTNQGEESKRAKYHVEQLQEQQMRLKKHVESQMANLRELQVRRDLAKKHLEALPKPSTESEKISEAKKELGHQNEEMNKLLKLIEKLKPTLKAAEEKQRHSEEEQTRYEQWEKDATEQKSALKKTLMRKTKISEQLHEEEKESKALHKEKLRHLEQIKRQQRSEDTRAEANRQLKRRADKKKLALLTELEAEMEKLQEKQKSLQGVRERETSVRGECQSVEEDVKGLKLHLEEVGAKLDANKEKIMSLAKSLNL
ncbi:golgin subfamily A member 6-like protein 26 [Cloeon dipterum]|uniref:golgin subfamily A member 6-like protein 26 n=1 Tax=Cloeon dipterum TaxID=197152 RepID=UPI00321FC093